MVTHYLNMIAVETMLSTITIWRRHQVLQAMAQTRKRLLGLHCFLGASSVPFSAPDSKRMLLNLTNSAAHQEYQLVTTAKPTVAETVEALSGGSTLHARNDGSIVWPKTPRRHWKHRKKGNRGYRKNRAAVVAARDNGAPDLIHLSHAAAAAVAAMAAAVAVAAVAAVAAVVAR
jgi:hypothetical protein